MGPPELQPPFPEFEWATLPASHRYNTKRLQECNYLQAMEGGIDSSHVSFLHSGDMHRDPLHREHQGRALPERPEAEIRGRGIPRRPVHRARAATPRRGITTGASPSGSCPGTRWCRRTATTRSTRHAWVPIDDENCFTWTFTYHPTRPLRDMELDVMRKGGGIHVPLIPGTFRPIINKDNDYLIDRAAQKRGETYCGVRGIAMQDASVQESMGPIQDRTKENLVSTDNAIIMARHRLLQGGARRCRRAPRRRASPAERTACARRPSCCRSTCRSSRPSATI